MWCATCDNTKSERIYEVVYYYFYSSENMSAADAQCRVSFDSWMDTQDVQRRLALIQALVTRHSCFFCLAAIPVNSQQNSLVQWKI